MQDQLRNMISRGRMLSGDDSGDYHRIKVRGLPGEEIDGVIRHQQHGISSNPGDGAEGLLLRLGGRAERTFAIGFELKGKRPRDLPVGATALYDEFGQVLKMVPTKADWDHAGKHSHLRGISRQKVEATEWIWLDCEAIYLGKGPWFPVVTTGGPSQSVYASVAPAKPDSPTPAEI
ncbi:phage baseplate assembly protein [Bosea sp. TWI1241]|uniref:phage baseplate assembly protein domain-containing protein n=1 Tax=Bosea sp. TWI1241 TaxID=3148904 RepID=UPI00320A9D3B